MLKSCGEETAKMEPPPGTVPVDKYEKLVVKYNDLAKRYRDLQGEHAKCEGWMAQFYEKYKGMKECVQQWQIYIDKRREKSALAAVPSNSVRDVPQEPTVTRVTSSQTTEAEQESSPPTAQDPSSDDTPQVVSARSLKRKRSRSAPVRIKQEEANSPQNPINLMSEDDSSPDMQRKQPMRAETSDLDAFVKPMETPRKRRRQRGASEEVARPPLLPLNTSSLSEGNVPDEQQLINLAMEGALESRHNDPAVMTRDFATDHDVDKGNSNVLRPRSVNIWSATPAIGIRQMANAKRKRVDRRKISILSEDGEDHAKQAAKSGSHATPGDNVKRCLDALLEEPTPNRQQLSTRRPPAPRTPRLQAQRAPPKPTPVSETPKVQTTGYKTPLGLLPPPPAALPEDEPLRDRPLSNLTLDDFRINPNFMGTDYAFSETFRGREQRRCLPGCTKPNCCGNAFRKAVEMGAVQSNKSDAEVLEAYLGRNYNQVVAAYSPAKRKDLLIQARAHAFASQHGKHRQAYERPRTPPGFWRTDMPTTQEAEEDRAKAHEMERQKVEERWREAMRDGGRWLFRDER
jgi:hypothetical protein